jgi:hypothetical protein
VSIKTDAHSFAKRAKKLELPLSDGRLWFHTSPWMDAVVQQFVNYDGITPSNSTRKDDAVSAISLMWEHFGPRTSVELTEISKEEQRERERQLDEDARREREAFYRQQMFGAGPRQEARDKENQLFQQPEAVEQSPAQTLQSRALPNYPAGRLFKFRR